MKIKMYKIKNYMDLRLFLNISLRTNLVELITLPKNVYAKRVIQGAF